MTQAKLERQPKDQPPRDTASSCLYVGEFHELSSETYLRYKAASQRFADIAERQAKGE